MKSAWGEVMEGYAETSKDLVRKWSDYTSQVVTKLDSGYDADSMSADLGTAVSLVIETGARLTWEAVDAMSTLLDAPSRPVFVDSAQFPTRYKGSKLTLKGELENRSGDILPAALVAVIPAELGPDESTFRIRANVAGCPAGIYRGRVQAFLSADQSQEVPVEIKVP